MWKKYGVFPPWHAKKICMSECCYGLACRYVPAFCLQASNSCVKRKFKADCFVFAGDTAAAAVPAFVRKTHFRFFFTHFKQISGAACHTFTAFFTFCCVKNRRHILLLLRLFLIAYWYFKPYFVQSKCGTPLSSRLVIRHLLYAGSRFG